MANPHDPTPQKTVSTVKDSRRFHATPTQNLLIPILLGLLGLVLVGVVVVTVLAVLGWMPG